MNHDEWLERAEIYALGALDGEELARFEAHLAAGCPRCEERLREGRETLVALPRSLAPLAPPPAVRARLLAEIGGGPGARERRRLGWLWWGVGAGALAAAGLLVVLTTTLTSVRREVERLEGRVAELRGELAQREEALRLLADPEVRVVRLSGLAPSPAAVGRLLWNPATRTGILLTTGLPQTAADRAYELWAIAGAEPVPAGVFSVDQAGRGLLRLPPLPAARTFDKFAVTLEPAGCVPKPTGPMHLLGAL